MEVGGPSQSDPVGNQDNTDKVLAGSSKAGAFPVSGLREARAGRREDGRVLSRVRLSDELRR